MLENLFKTGTLLNFVFKTIGILLSIFYLLFIIVLGKQVQVMTKVVKITDRGLLLLAVYVQLVLALVLLIYSLFIL